MNIYEIVANAPTLYETKTHDNRPQPFLLIGAPGVAKSSIIEGAFKDALSQYLQGPVDVITDIASTRESPDFRGLGIPVRPQDGSPAYIAYPKPDLCHRVENSPALQHPNGLVILFLDELLQSGQDTQKVLCDSILNYRLGEHELPDRTWIIGASNRQKDGAGVNRPLTILTNRLASYEVELPVEYYCRWARAKGIHPVGISFVERFPVWFGQDQPPKEGAFCSYRSFTQAMKAISAWNKIHSKPSTHVENNTFISNTITGYIGEGATREFMAFASVVDQLPSRFDILNHPDTTPVPNHDRIDAQYVAANMAYAIATEPDSPLNMIPAARYLLRLPNKELAVKTVIELNKSTGGAVLMNNPDIVQFVAKNKALIMDSVL